MNHAGPTLREGSGKGFLFHGRQMVLGGTADGDSEVSESKTISDKGGPHDCFLLVLVCNKCISG